MGRADKDTMCPQVPPGIVRFNPVLSGPTGLGLCGHLGPNETDERPILEGGHRSSDRKRSPLCWVLSPLLSLWAPTATVSSSAATTVRVAGHSTTPSRAWPDLAHVTVGPGPATTKPSNSSSESLECCCNVLGLWAEGPQTGPGL